MKKVVLIFLLCVHITAIAGKPDEMPQSVFDEIVGEVIAESGYYDAIAVEEAITQWLLDQPLPATDAVLVDSGACSTCEADVSGIDESLPQPKNIKFKGRKNQNKALQGTFSIYWKEPNALPNGSSYELSHYRVYIIKNNQDYEVYEVLPKTKRNGKIVRNNQIKFRDYAEGNYQVQVQAIYSDTTGTNSAAKSNSAKSVTYSSSGWTDGSLFTLSWQYKTVADLTGAIKTCINAAGYADSEPLQNFVKVDCRNSGLLNSDVDQLVDFVNVQSVVLDNNPSITDMSALIDLTDLSLLSLEGNSNINIQFGTPSSEKTMNQLTDLYLANMGLSSLPDLSLLSNLEFLDLSDNQIQNGFELLPASLTTLVLNNNPVTSCSGLSGKIIESIEVQGTSITDIADCSSVNELKYLSVKDAPNLVVDQYVNDFSGFCGLNIENTSITAIRGARPIGSLTLTNNSDLNTINVIKTGKTNTDNEYPDLIPPYVNFTGSPKVLCKNLFKVEDRWSTHTKLDMTSPIYTKVNGVEKTSPVCPVINQEFYFHEEASCKPDTIVDLSATKTNVNNQYSLSWDQTDHTTWGVTTYEVRKNVGQSDETVIVVPADMTLPVLQTNKSLIPSFEVRACKAEYDANHVVITNTCGEWSNSTLEPGLSKVINLDYQFTSGNNQTFTLQFSYPDDDLGYESNVPAYFEINPTLEPDNVIVIPNVNYVDGILNYTSSVMDIENFLSREFTVRACKATLAEDCGKSAFIRVTQPSVTPGPNIVAPALISEANNLSNGTFTFGVSTTSNIDYFDVVETQPVAVIDGPPVANPDNQKVYRVETDNNQYEFDLARKVNGKYYFKISGCKFIENTNQQESECSDPLELGYAAGDSSWTVNRVVNNTYLYNGGEDKFLKNLEWGGVWCSDSYDANRASIVNGQLQGIGCLQPDWGTNPGGVYYKKRKIYWKYQKTIGGSTDVSIPDYYYFSKINMYDNGENIHAIDSTSGSNIQNYNLIKNMCISKQASMYDVNGTNSNPPKFAKQQFVVNNDYPSDTQADILSFVRNDCPGGIRVSNDGLWKIQACYSGIGCTEGKTIDLLDSDYARYGESEANIADVTEANPENLQSGLWWNPHQSGTGWYFYWKNNSPNPNKEVRTSQNLLAYWVAYKEIDNVWSPIWLHSEMSLTQSNDSNDQYYAGQLFYTYINQGVKQKQGIGTLKILINQNQENYRAKAVLDIDGYGNNSDGILNITQDSINMDYSGLSDDYFELEYGVSGDEIDNVIMPLELSSIRLVGEDPSLPNPADGVDEQRFSSENDNDHYSGVWEYDSNDDSKDATIVSWIRHNLEVIDYFVFDDTGTPIWLQSQSCGYPCIEPVPEYFDGYVENDNNNLYLKGEGFNPLGYVPGYPLDPSIFIANAGRLYTDPNIDFDPEFNDFNTGGFWLDGSFNLSTSNNNSRGFHKSWGSSTSLKHMHKVANINHIGYNIQDSYDKVQYENIETGLLATTCDPNIIGPCSASINWYVDDYAGQNQTIKPYYRYSGPGVSMADFAPLDIASSYINCPSNPPTGSAINAYKCEGLLEGTYEFQLRRKEYNSTNYIAIAQAENLTVIGCNIAGDPDCSTALIEPPAQAPEPLDLTGTLSIDTSTDMVGTTSGAFDIDESGNANYNIPIFAPASTGGLAPQLALTYNSNAPNGIAGVGWNISGISSITRCLKSPEQDPGLSSYPAIQLNQNDALCIDGQRMFETTDSSGNTYYRTEIDNFSKIVPSSTQAGNGPANFIVYTKSGEVRVYGSSGADFKGDLFVNGTGAQILANDNSGTVHTWLLNKIKDRTANQNSIHFVYDTFEGENYLSKVKWTSPTAGGLSNQNRYEIEFKYSDTRPDKVHHYSIGSEFKLQRYLEYVSTKARSVKGGALTELRRLKLNYEDTVNGSSPSGMLRISSVEECRNVSGLICLKPIEFEWDNNNTQIGFESSVESSTYIGKMDEIGLGGFKQIDINGDGISELIFVRSYDDGDWLFENPEAKFYFMAHAENSSQWTNCQNIIVGYWNKQCDLGIQPVEPDGNQIDFDNGSWFVYDFNSDGKDDLLTPHQDSETWVIYLSNGSTLNYGINTNIPYANKPGGDPLIPWASSSSILDFTNDGLPDLLTPVLDPNTNHLKYRIFKGNVSNGILSYSYSSPDFSDVDLDTGNIRYDCADLDGVSECSGNVDIIVYDIQPGVADFNGDGYADAVVQYYQSFFGTGCNDQRPGEWGSCWLHAYAAVEFVPENGNGNAEYRFIKNIGITNRSSYFDEITIFKNSLRYMDINGDGLTDMVYRKYYPDSSTQYYVWAYRLNQGSFDSNGRIEFSDVKYFGIDDGQTNNIVKVLNFDCNGDIDCGNRISAFSRLTQFIDYDLDGDIDILYASETGVNNEYKYKLAKYDSDSPYAVHETTNIVAYDSTGDARAFDHINVFSDFSGDGHADYFQVYRGVDGTKKQKFVYGNGRKQTRNKITKIINVIDNLSLSTDINYLPATDTNVYEDLHGSLSITNYGNGSPVFDIFSPMYLVRSTTKHTPGYNPTTMRYHYTGLKVQAGGRGSLGFAEIESLDIYRNIRTITSYKQDFPYIGMPESTISYLGTVNDGHLLSESYSFYEKGITLINGHKTYFPYLNKSWEYEYPANTDIAGVTTIGDVIQKSIYTEFTYDAVDILNGNITQTISTTYDGEPDANGTNWVVQKQTDNDYADDNVNWLLGRLSKADVTSKRKTNGVTSTKVKKSKFYYDSVTGQMIDEIIDSASANNYLRISHVIDDYGQETATYQCSNHFADRDECINSIVTARPIDHTFVHRYSKVVYDNEWHEFVDKKIEPFTTYSNDYDLNGSANTILSYIANNPGTTNEQTTMQVLSRDVYGNPTSVEDLHGNVKATVYGRFGQAQATATNLGSKTVTTKQWCSESNEPELPADCSIIVVTTPVVGPIAKKYLDILGREVRSQTQDINGDWTTVDTLYDDLGRTILQSEPYTRNQGNNTPLNNSSLATETQYDLFDRVIKVISPDHCEEDPLFPDNPCLTVDVITSTEYEGLSVTTSKLTADPLGQKTTQVFDVTGKVIESKDNNEISVTYEYDALGNLVKTTGPLATIVMGYDELGRKTSMTDPDKGIWSYSYNAAGDMYHSSNNENSNSYSYFDVKGRKYLTIDGDSELSIWDYDVVDIGLLSKEYSLRGYNTGNYNPGEVIQMKQYLTDIYKRPETTITSVYDGENANEHQVYTSSVTYDEYGRLYQSFDATGNGVLYQYNNYGYQNITRDAANGENGQIYHEVLNTDSRGNVIYEKFYNTITTTRYYDQATGFLQTIKSTSGVAGDLQDLSYAFDRLGNLIRRTNYLATNHPNNTNITETFKYDGLNRIKEEYMDEILKNSYVYDESGNLKTKGTLTLTYSQNNDAGPHAVISNSNGDGYIYDNVGNVITRTGNNPATFAYTSFNKPHTISANGWTSEVAYGAGRSRYIRKDIDSSTSSRKTTHYLGSVEYIYKSGQSFREAKRYIGNLVINITNDSTHRGQWKYHFLLKDHLGSTDIIVDQQGNYESAMSFNAWGQRRTIQRNSTSGNYDPILLGMIWGQMGSDIEEYTNKGFTGHEHFDQVGIIHMNGRIYDSSIGRFLQADPVIQDPYNTQSLNRYSYVMNNPLSYTDPTGYARLRKGWWRMPLAIGITVWTAGAANQLLFTAGLSPTSLAAAATMKVQAFWLVVGGGAASGAITTGNLKGAVKGGITAALTFGIGHGAAGGASPFGDTGRMLAHAAVSGISSEVDGGKFGHGFVSAILSQKLGTGKIFDHRQVGKAAIVTNAILQGTISEVTGGKFSNGAMSAAFRVAFNHVMEGEKRPHSHNGIKYDNKGRPYPGRGYAYSPITGEWMTADDAALTSVHGQETHMPEYNFQLEGGGGAHFLVGYEELYSTVNQCHFITKCISIGPGAHASIGASLNIESGDFDTSLWKNTPKGTWVDGSTTIGGYGNIKVFGKKIGFDVNSDPESFGIPIPKTNFGVGSGAGFKGCRTQFDGCY